MIKVKRKTKYENRYHPNMGRIRVKVTSIYKTFLGIPYKIIHRYRETYYGEVKDINDCNLDK